MSIPCLALNLVAVVWLRSIVHFEWFDAGWILDSQLGLLIRKMTAQRSLELQCLAKHLPTKGSGNKEIWKVEGQKSF